MCRLAGHTSCDKLSSLSLEQTRSTSSCRGAIVWPWGPYLINYSQLFPFTFAFESSFVRVSSLFSESFALPTLFSFSESLWKMSFVDLSSVNLKALWSGKLCIRKIQWKIIYYPYLSGSVDTLSWWPKNIKMWGRNSHRPMQGSSCTILLSLFIFYFSRLKKNYTMTDNVNERWFANRLCWPSFMVFWDLFFPLPCFII